MNSYCSEKTADQEVIFQEARGVKCIVAIGVLIGLYSFIKIFISSFFISTFSDSQFSYTDLNIGLPSGTLKNSILGGGLLVYISTLVTVVSISIYIVSLLVRFRRAIASRGTHRGARAHGRAPRACGACQGHAASSYFLSARIKWSFGARGSSRQKWPAMSS